MANALLKDEKHCRSTEELWCATEVQTTSVSFTWTIKNFSFVIKGLGNKLRSPYFSSNRAYSDIKWCLEITKPFYYDYDDDDYHPINPPLLSLCSSSTTKNPVFAKYTLHILDKDNEKCTLVEQGEPRAFRGTARGDEHQSLNFNKLFDDPENLLLDDSLKLLCEDKL